MARLADCGCAVRDSLWALRLVALVRPPDWIPHARRLGPRAEGGAAMSAGALSGFSAVEFRAIRHYADENNLTPQLSVHAEGSIHFRAKATGAELVVDLATIMTE